MDRREAVFLCLDLAVRNAAPHRKRTRTSGFFYVWPKRSAWAFYEPSPPNAGFFTGEILVLDLLAGLWCVVSRWWRNFRFRLRGSLEFEVEYRPSENLPTDPTDD